MATEEQKKAILSFGRLLTLGHTALVYDATRPWSEESIPLRLSEAVVERVDGALNALLEDARSDADACALLVDGLLPQLTGVVADWAGTPPKRVSTHICGRLLAIPRSSTQSSVDASINRAADQESIKLCRQYPSEFLRIWEVAVKRRSRKRAAESLDGNPSPPTAQSKFSNTLKRFAVNFYGLKAELSDDDFRKVITEISATKRVAKCFVGQSFTHSNVINVLKNPSQAPKTWLLKRVCMQKSIGKVPLEVPTEYLRHVIEWVERLTALKTSDDAEVAARQLEALGAHLCLTHIPTSWFNNHAVVLAALTSLRRADALKLMGTCVTNDLFSADDIVSAFRGKMLDVDDQSIRLPEELLFARLAAQRRVTRANQQIANRGAAQTAKLSIGHAPLAAVDDAYVSALKAVGGTGAKLLFCLDTRQSVLDGRIGGGLTGERAMTALLSRACHAADAASVLFWQLDQNHVRVKAADMPVDDGDASIKTFLRANQSPNAPVKVKLPLEWAETRKHEFDVLVVVCDNLACKVGMHRPRRLHSALRDYNEATGRRARAVLVGLFDVAAPADVPLNDDLLVIAGFDVFVPELIRRFCLQQL